MPDSIKQSVSNNERTKTAPGVFPQDEHVDIISYLDSVKVDVIEQIRRIIPNDTAETSGLYRLMMDYPLRDGKALRPSISVAVCRTLGGSVQSVLPTAAVLELYHNAFLIHDDIEDQSEYRRKQPTLHRIHGVPTAVNVGDGMLSVTIAPLLENTELIGLGSALKILRVISHMSRISAEGQMTELTWIRENLWGQADGDYVRMVHKKTGWYSFVAPAMVGAIAARAPDGIVARLGRIFIPLGIAFQIKDDLLNLASDEEGYDKDLFGDLWEGKHTLILIHAMRSASKKDRDRCRMILEKDRPSETSSAMESSLEIKRFIKLSARAGDIKKKHCKRLLRKLESITKSDGPSSRTPDDIRFLRNLIRDCGSMEYAEAVANKYALRFQTGLERFLEELPNSVHTRFLQEIGKFAVSRHR